MIDYVSLRLNIIIPNNYFSPMMWKRSKTEDGQPFRWRTVKGVKLKYYEETHNFTINGKILMFLHDTQVQNVDDIYGAHIHLFVDELNGELNKLFPEPMLDIRDFKVTRIDYCINVETPYVKAYDRFMSHAFQMTNGDKRVDFTNEHNLTGSVYAKTASDYEDNSNKNYTINFYDKSDRLTYLEKEGVYVSEADKILAENIYRLEVQCGYQIIKRQTAKFGIHNTLGELLDYKIAYDTIFYVYTLAFKGTFDADYYTYADAKKFLKGQQAAQKAIYVAASHRITEAKYAYGAKKAKEQGVYPYCFLPKKGAVSYLENPIKLLHRKLNALGVLP